MGQNPSPASRQQPILRPLTPRSKASRFAAMAGIGAASALAGAVAVIVYTNAVSNPKVLDASAVRRPRWFRRSSRTMPMALREKCPGKKTTPQPRKR